MRPFGAGGRPPSTAPEDRLRRKIETLRARCRRLEESETLYRNVARLAKAGICIVLDGVVRHANSRLAEILGHPREALVGRPVLDFVHPGETDKIALAQERFNAAGGFDQRFETALIGADGRRVQVELNLTMTPFQGHRAGLALLYDLTDRRRAEAHVRELTQRILRAQEDERQRISRYLHDQVGQDLSTLKILCATLHDDETDPSGRPASLLRRMTDQLQGTIDAVRALAYDLRPPGLDRLGLVRTLVHRCEDFAAETGLAVDFSSAGLEGMRLAPDLEINVYRILQEALHNVRRHAAAERVMVRLVASSPHLVLRVKDNGKGFVLNERTAAARRRRRMGLQSMAERARLLGGHMHITTRPGKGTSIYVETPLVTV